MDISRPNNLQKLVTLQEAAQKLGVSVPVLLQWNEYNILKPTITTSGTVGYTEAQLDQFLRIQQSLQANKAISPLPHPTFFQPTRVDAEPTTIASNKLPEDSFMAQKHTKASTRFFAPMIAIVVVLAVGFLTQQGQFKSILNQYQKSYQANSTQPRDGEKTSTLDFTSPFKGALTTQPKSDGTLSKESQNTDASVFAAKPTNIPVIQKSHIAIISNPQNKVLSASTAATITALQAQKGLSSHEQNTILPDGTRTSDASTFATTITRNTSPQGSNSPFDSTGNITGKTNTLATILGSEGLIGEHNSFQQSGTNSRNQFILVAMCTLGLFLYFMRTPKKALISASLPIQNNPLQKILEIDQKMDGTVVLYFQGKDYKISKPELHSDSDQFIERLMELSQPGSKEIEYDNFKDEQIKLNTPLSRLVTRLGFVGIKRDLFFPRTSKHNVLFRKYITQQDLTAMHLTADQIFNDLTQSI